MLGQLDPAIRSGLTLLGLGLLMAFSPTTFGIELRAAHRAPSVRRRVSIVVLGVASAATLLAALMSQIGPAVINLLPEAGALRSVLTARWLDLTAGALLILAGSWRWLRSRKPTRPTRLLVDLDRPVVLLVVVFIDSLVSTTGPATMYLVVRIITEAREVVWPLEYAVFLLGLALPYLILGLLVARLPAPEQRRPPWVRHQLIWRRATSLTLVLAGSGLVVVRLATR